MDFDTLLDQATALLKTQRRISYAALRRRLNLEPDDLEAIRDELIHALQVAADENDKVIVWLGGDTADTEQAGMAERRQISVVFCDLVGSTKLSATFDPEDFRELIGEYQHSFAGVFTRFGGYVAQYLGDGILVYFGYPRAHEHDAKRAVSAALEALKSLEQVNARLLRDRGISLQVRIGIHTGMVVVGDIGVGESREQLALGEAPNVAARIEGLADPDSVVVSAATLQLLEHHFEATSLGVHALKGIDGDFEVFRIGGRSGVQSRFDQAVSHELLPMVGRQEEFAQLCQAWRRASTGQLQVVLLEGESGIGKSRVAQALKDHVAGEDGTWAALRCSEQRRNTALYPLIQLWRQQLNWREITGRRRRIEALETRLAEFGMDVEENLPAMAWLMSLPLAGTGHRDATPADASEFDRLLQQLAEIGVAVAMGRPMLLLVEDIDWSDTTSLQMLGHFCEHAAGRAALLLMTARPTFRAPWFARYEVQRVLLGRLPRRDIERMAAAVVGGKSIDPELMREIVQRTDGIPAYVEELTKTLAASPLLEEHDGRLTLSGPLEDEIPATLQETLTARLDRLGEAKKLAQAASVLGRSFPEELLNDVTDLEPAARDEQLQQLLRAGILRRLGRDETATLIFKHRLLQEAAYQSLLKSVRQSHHASIAKALVERFPHIVEQEPEILARHLTEAGHSEEAIGHWQWAGEQAVKRFANADAVAHLRKGLALVKSLPASPLRDQRELALLTVLGPAQIALRGWAAPELEAIYARTTALCAEGAVEQDFQVLAGVCAFHMLRGENTTAHALARRMFREAKTQDEPQMLLAAHTCLGGTSFYRGELQHAHEHFQAVLASYDVNRQAPLSFMFGQDPAVISLAWLATTVWLQGDAQRGKRYNQEAVDLATRIASPFSLGFAQSWQARLLLECGELELALATAEEVLVRAERRQQALYESLGRIVKGAAQARLHSDPGAIATLHEGIDNWRATGAGSALPYFYAAAAATELAAGLHAAANRSLRQAESLAAAKEEHWWDAELLRLRARLLSADGQEAEAQRRLHDALAVAETQGAVTLARRAAKDLAGHLERQGEVDEARRVLAAHPCAGAS